MCSACFGGGAIIPISGRNETQPNAELPKTVVDLWAGMGSFAWAYEQVGWTTVAAYENQNQLEATYHMNHPGVSFVCMDLTDPRTWAHIPNTTCIAAGTPCPPFYVCD